jgi:hypothetical protein
MTTKHISTSHEQEVCEICGRTLLRGEHAEMFLDGGRRHAVCELCKPYALQEGWMREGSVPAGEPEDVAAPRRRSLFGRRGRRRPEPDTDPYGADPGELSLDDELAYEQPPRRRPRAREPLADERGDSRARTEQVLDQGLGFDEYVPAPSEPAATRRPEPSREQLPREQLDPDRERRPRRRGSRGAHNVHAVPIDAEQKIDAALEVFNASRHPRTIAGVARSLGAPGVQVEPDPQTATLVWIVAAWELCWYRYEVDLSIEPGRVRLDSQGDELAELGAQTLRPNAVADANGRLRR